VKTGVNPQEVQGATPAKVGNLNDLGGGRS